MQKRYVQIINSKGWIYLCKTFVPFCVLKHSCWNVPALNSVTIWFFFLFLHSIVFDGLSWKFWILNLDIFLSLNFVFLKQLLLSLQTEGSLNMIALSKIFYGLLYIFLKFLFQYLRLNFMSLLNPFCSPA